MLFGSLLPKLGRAFTTLAPHIPTILPMIGSAVSAIFGKGGNNKSSETVTPTLAPSIPSGLGTASSFRRYEPDSKQFELNLKMRMINLAQEICYTVLEMLLIW